MRFLVLGELGLGVVVEVRHVAGVLRRVEALNQFGSHLVRLGVVDAALHGEAVVDELLNQGTGTSGVACSASGPLSSRAHPGGSLGFRNIRSMWQAVVAFSVAIGVPAAIVTVSPLLARPWLLGLATASLLASAVLAVQLVRGTGGAGQVPGSGVTVDPSFGR